LDVRKYWKNPEAFSIEIYPSSATPNEEIVGSSSSNCTMRTCECVEGV